MTLFSRYHFRQRLVRVFKGRWVEHHPGSFRFEPSGRVHHFVYGFRVPRRVYWVLRRAK